MLQFIADSRARQGTAASRGAYRRVMTRLARHAGLRVFRVFARRLAAQTPRPPRDLECRLMGEGEVLRLCADPSLELSAAKVRAAWGRGDLCVAAFDRGQLAGYCWFALSAAPHMERAWLDFPPELVYTYKSYVRPAFRGRGIAAALYRAADPLFLDRGRRTALICVESHESASIAAARRGGFAGTGYAAYIGGAHLRAWCSPAAARHGLRFYVPE